jgi:hypothetical protein
LVNKELYALENEGFTIESRETEGSKEHFVILFNDPGKIKPISRENMSISLHKMSMLYRA